MPIRSNIAAILTASPTQEEAVKGLSALAQVSRLEVFRLLAEAGPEGLAAGAIARRLKTPANTMSAQLLILSNARLVNARREGRSILYAANYETMRDLLIYLVKDCCDGHAEICAPLMALPTVSAHRKSVKRMRRHAGR